MRANQPETALGSAHTFFHVKLLDYYVLFCGQDPKLVTWAHETLIQLLDSDLLPVYLDVLQILKSKVCQVQLIVIL